MIAGWNKVLLLLCLRVIFILPLQSQATSFNFRHLTNTEGLSDGVVRAIVQDKYGYMWIGTSYGLNRFDGISIKGYFSKRGDSTSIGNNFIQSLYRDSKSNIWIGTFSGLSRYDDTRDQFVNYSSPRPILINDIIEDKNGTMWLVTDDGLWTVDQQKLSILPFTNNNDKNFIKIIHGLIRQIMPAKDGNFYMASTTGIKIFNPVTKEYGEIIHDPSAPISISSNPVISISFDSSGFLWATCTYPSLLNKIDLKNRTVKTYDHFITAQKDWSNNALLKIMTDQKGRVWVTAGFSGLTLYNEKKDNFYDYKNYPFIPNSLLFNSNMSIYQGVDGTIWLGSPGYGLSYFNPDKNFFHSIYPFLSNEGVITDTWCRSVCEDKEGNIWLATGKGVALYDSTWHLLRTFTNDAGKKPVLQSNSGRSLLLDDNGDIWIGTALGLNRYHPSTGKMDFFDEHQGIPHVFFWMFAKDTNGSIWLGAAQGLYHYLRNENRFDDLTRDTVLSKFAHYNVQALYADHKNRLWIGLLDVGLVEYDIDLKTEKILTIKDSLISDTRFSSFAEDKEGMLWIGSEEGLTMYDPVKNKSRFFKRENGLPSNRTNNIMVDSLDRIWIGTSNGLCVLNETRDKIKRFDVNDGLLTNQFNEQSAFQTSNGLFIFPTYKGFLFFRPEDFRENISNVPVLISSFSIPDQKDIINPENLQHIDLRYDQNFFNIELAGLNYMNPYQCRYAYQLVPFDKNWIYSRKREINYTNVPSGHYSFRYKVITDNPDWNVPEKVIGINISQVFYETVYFRFIILFLIGAIIIAFFRYRLSYRESLLVLKNKAQLLEKEKTLVMYENLKQHLNPHFLFNSLTSLSSLITMDQKMAGDFLDKMSKVYRYILKNRENETVPLSEELKFVTLYNQLQKTRFEKGLVFNVNIDEEYYHRKIAPVTLQNLVENAIKHNIADADSPLVIDLFVEDDYLVVRNNLQRKSFVETSNKQGLSNMISLYHYLSSRPMVVREDEYFTVKIPLL